MCHGRLEHDHGRGLVIISVVILPLALLTLIPVMAVPRRDLPGGAASRHPESMTETLAADAEEYLAWLADRHWPDDDYLDLERGWQSDVDPFGTHEDRPVCP